MIRSASITDRGRFGSVKCAEASGFERRRHLESQAMKGNHETHTAARTGIVAEG